MVRRFLCALLALLPAPALAGRVALTFDDLPALTIVGDQGYADALTIKLIAGLKRHHLRATAFVNEGKLAADPPAQTANLARWIDAGFELGNHTYGHVSPNDVGEAAYVADIVRGEPVTRALLARHGLRLRWFRHPYLATGSPLPVRQAIDRWLADHGYRIAPVTIDADDWEFAEPYDDAIRRGDRREQARIRQAYLAHTAIRVAWSQASARVLFGRDIAHVMLLHATRLNADSIDPLTALLRRAHLRSIGLDRALRDPAYRTPDDYAGMEGPDWLARWAQHLRKTLPSDGDIDPPAWIQAAYDRVDNDRAK